MTRFTCKNVGFSPGKFCIMTRKSWPPASFRVSKPGVGGWLVRGYSLEKSWVWTGATDVLPQGYRYPRDHQC